MIVVKNKIENKYKNVYILEMYWMHGDADAYTTTEESYVEDEIKKIEEHYSTLNKKLEGWDGGNITQEEFSSIFKNEDILVPWDVTDVSYQFLAKLYDIKIFYYDSFGNKYNCEIKENDNAN